jgi:tetratricopeptide (TPR) repeat protein
METAAKEIFFNIGPFSDQTNIGNLTRRPAISYLKSGAKLLCKGKKEEYLFENTELLVGLADSIYIQRRFELLEYVGALLLHGKSRGAGEYYLALAAKNKGFIRDSLFLLEKATTSDDLRIRAKAFSTIGAILLEQNRIDESLSFRLKALRLASRDYCEPLIIVEAQRAIANLKSINGDHKKAIADLEQILPVATIIGKREPVIYYDVLNSLAVELGEAGRVEEGCRALSIALASPFAFAYPHWHATRAELIERGLRASRSVVAVGKLLEGPNVLPFALALARAKDCPFQGGGSGSIQHIDDWKMNTKQPKKEPELTTREKQAEIINTVLECEDEELDAVREFLKKLRSDSKDASES